MDAALSSFAPERFVLQKKGFLGRFPNNRGAILYIGIMGWLRHPFWETQLNIIVILIRFWIPAGNGYVCLRMITGLGFMAMIPDYPFLILTL